MNKFNSTQEQIRFLIDRLQTIVTPTTNEDCCDTTSTTDSLQESTLSALIGDSPGGQSLVSYLHKNYKLSNTADWHELTKNTKRVQWEMFKEFPNSFIVIMGRNAVVAIKPLPKAGTAPYQNDPTGNYGDNTRLYYVVGFRQDQRIDNEFLVVPEKPKKMTADEYADLEHRILQQRQVTISPNAPATKYDIRRGGIPFGRDPVPNFFDRIKKVLGGINAIYVSTTRQEMPRGTDVKGYVKNYKPGEIPAKDITDPSRPGTHGAVPADVIAQRGEKWASDQEEQPLTPLQAAKARRVGRALPK